MHACTHARMCVCVKYAYIDDIDALVCEYKCSVKVCTAEIRRFLNGGSQNHRFQYILRLSM